MRIAVIVVALLVLAATGWAEEVKVPVTIPQTATLKGELFKPEGGGPFPTVILLHGCGGMTPSVLTWAKLLQADGYAALALDSFSTRGIQSQCGDSSALPMKTRANDIAAAAIALKEVPAVDSSRLAAMGFSHGGGTVLWADASPISVPGLRALIAFYPGACGRIQGLRGTTPLLMLLGDKDTWTPPDPCQELAKRAKDAGGNVAVIRYPDAEHGFDMEFLLEPGRSRTPGRAKNPSSPNAVVAYNPAAYTDSQVQVHQFLGANIK